MTWRWRRMDRRWHQHILMETFVYGIFDLANAVILFAVFPTSKSLPSPPLSPIPICYYPTAEMTPFAFMIFVPMRSSNPSLTIPINPVPFLFPSSSPLPPFPSPFPPSSPSLLSLLPSLFPS